MTWCRIVSKFKKKRIDISSKARCSRVPYLQAQDPQPHPNPQAHLAVLPAPWGMASSLWLKSQEIWGNKASKEAVVSRLRSMKWRNDMWQVLGMDVYWKFVDVSKKFHQSTVSLCVFVKTETIDYHGLVDSNISNLRCGMNSFYSSATHWRLKSQVASQSLCHLERYLSRILCWQAPFFLPFTMLAWSISAWDLPFSTSINLVTTRHTKPWWISRWGISLPIPFRA